MKKTLALVLVLTMVLSLAACSGSDDSSDKGNSDGTMTEKNDDKETDNNTGSDDTGVSYDGTWGTKLVDEPVEIKFFARGGNEVALDPESIFWTKYQEMTGVTIIATANSNVDKVTDLNVHATDRFPSDIISVAHEGEAMVRYAAEGAFLNILDYIHLMPNLQAFIETDLGKQAYEASLSSDGELFLIPAVERFKPTHVPMIRKDWLDKVGLEVPQTTDELYTALKTFKDEELGDGLTIPFLAKDWVLKQNAPVLFGARVETRATGRVVNDEDGNFSHGWSSDAFRHVVEEYSKWYDEGILAQDIFTADKPLEKHFPTDQGGFTYWSISKLGFNDQPDMPEGFELVPIYPTAYNEAGDRLDQRATHFMRKGRIGISAAAENPEVAAMVIDTFLSEEGARTGIYGFEGEQYTMDYVTDDGISIYRNTPEWEAIVEADYNNDLSQARNDNGFIGIGISHDAFYDQSRVIKSDEEFGSNVVDQVEKMFLDAFNDGTITFIPAVTVSFSPDQLVEINTIKGALETYQNEFFELSIVQDHTTLDQEWWDNYLATCKDLGMDRIVEIYNEGL